ncbi:MAG TPA: fumarylacetoacetate hydrolase family protein [Aestuariivirgaceae bacterium]|jgi:fumarylacetoacetate (FAA) hydrolase family protein
MPSLISHLTPENTLPRAAPEAPLAGRLWLPRVEGPAIVKLEGEHLCDISRHFPTMRDLCEASDPAFALRRAKGEPVATLAEALLNTPSAGRERSRPWLLAPIDLQAIKAAGVTFATSMLERVIEERARGNPGLALSLRSEITALIGDDLSRLKPGSAEAEKLKALLLAGNMWSQYLEVGIGPDAEIFTKSQVMSAVGHGADAGIHRISRWNNPEPEVVAVVASSGRIVGAALGNDVNLRDVEGRSALLLGKAKDNNASCALGPFIRFFDGDFTLDSVRTLELSLSVEGEDGFTLVGGSVMSKISRDPEDLVRQMVGPHHQYPDGAVLFLGTLFAPVKDRDVPGEGFTHKRGDIVAVSASELGCLVNRMVYSDEAEPWTFGVGHLMRNLAARRLI